MALTDILKGANPIALAIEGVNAIKGVVDEFNFSEEEKAKVLSELEKIDGAIAVADANGHSAIQRTARPGTIWMWNGTLIAMLWVNYIVSPIVVWFGREAIYAPIPDLVWLYAAGVTGLSNIVYFIARTWDKNGGIGRWQKQK